ncbi:hypothetical protein [Ornithinimicrobium kibberense]|uniref:hypothetical protein n=1 Tax=Ornithinimicrobium kibberense TaxID=282060 RepID=UPI0036145EA2
MHRGGLGRVQHRHGPGRGHRVGNPVVGVERVPDGQPGPPFPVVDRAHAAGGQPVRGRRAVARKTW